MNEKQLISEIRYKASRSSGPGGQHTNKVSSKVILIFNLMDSEAFQTEEKLRLRSFFKGRINNNGIIQLSSEESRSQLTNKKIVTERFLELITEGLKVEKKRKKTKPSRAAILKSKDQKKRLSEKKNLRKKPKL